MMKKDLEQTQKTNPTVLTKQFLIVWRKEEAKTMIVIHDERNTGNVYPGLGTDYAEFDTQEELQQFITENNLTEEISPQTLKNLIKTDFEIPVKLPEQPKLYPKIKTTTIKKNQKNDNRQQHQSGSSISYRSKPKSSY